MICRAYAGVTLWWLGYPDQALQRSHEALTLARELAHPFSVVSALFFAAWLHHLRRERQLTHERAEALIALATEHSYNDEETLQRAKPAALIRSFAELMPSLEKLAPLG